MSGEVNFDVVAKEFRVSITNPPPRTGDHIRLQCALDSLHFKSSDTGFVGGEARPKCEYKGRFNLRNASLLDSKYFEVTVINTATGREYGRSRVDLYTVATGPIHHNLPILDDDDNEVGRLLYALEFSEVSDVLVTFKELKFRQLNKPGPTKNRPAPNAYVKYAYSAYWPMVQANRMRACYSTVVKRSRSPEWRDLPPIRFTASLRDMLRKSITLHVKHRGKIGGNNMLGRVNLLFRTLAERGSAVKQDDFVGFSGTLAGGAEIEGLMQFKRLPKLAQMVNATSYREAVHTEKGILDGMPLMHYMPTPKGWTRPANLPARPVSYEELVKEPEPQERPRRKAIAKPVIEEAPVEEESNSDSAMEEQPVDEPDTNPFRRMMREEGEELDSNPFRRPFSRQNSLPNNFGSNSVEPSPMLTRQWSSPATFQAQQPSPMPSPSLDSLHAPGVRGLMPAAPFVYSTEPAYNPFVNVPQASQSLPGMASLSPSWDSFYGSAPPSPGLSAPGTPRELYEAESFSIGLQSRPAAILPMDFFEIKKPIISSFRSGPFSDSAAQQQKTMQQSNPFTSYSSAL